MTSSQLSRAYMSPLSPGPWLDDVRSTYRSVGVLTMGMLCLLGTMLWWVLASNAMPSVLMAVLPCVGICSMVVGIIQLPLSLLQRRRTQTCPVCLGRMDRGVTSCPHCEFASAQENR
jgi:hypothetical protein